MGFDDEEIIYEGKDGGFKVVYTNKRVCILELQQASRWEEVLNPVYKLNVYHPLETIREIHMKTGEVPGYSRIVTMLDDGTRIECDLQLGAQKVTDVYFESSGTSRTFSPQEKEAYGTQYPGILVETIKSAILARRIRIRKAKRNSRRPKN